MDDRTSLRSRARKEQTRSVRTRRLLLDATVECMVELGYGRTTTHEVARRAGMTRGALLHHYPTKQKLVTAALAHLDWLRLRDFQERFAEIEPAEDVADRVVEIIWSLMHDRRAYVELELLVAARTDPELHAANAVHSQRRKELAGQAQRDSLGIRGDESPRARVLRNFVFNHLRGLSIAILFAEKPDEVQIQLDILKELVRTTLERARR